MCVCVCVCVCVCLGSPYICVCIIYGCVYVCVCVWGWLPGKGGPSAQLQRNPPAVLSQAYRWHSDTVYWRLGRSRESHLGGLLPRASLPCHYTHGRPWGQKTRAASSLALSLDRVCASDGLGAIYRLSAHLEPSDRGPGMLESGTLGGLWGRGPSHGFAGPCEALRRALLSRKPSRGRGRLRSHIALGPNPTRLLTGSGH